MTRPRDVSLLECSLALALAAIGIFIGVPHLLAAVDHLVCLVSSAMGANR